MISISILKEKLVEKLIEFQLKKKEIKIENFKSKIEKLLGLKSEVFETRESHYRNHDINVEDIPEIRKI
jgi:hypothetical protein